MSLIATFKSLDRDNAQDTLDDLAADNNVFSAQLITTQAPFLEGHGYYVYMQDDEAVFLLKDKHHDNTDVLADEETFMDQPPLYFIEGGYWTSPVYLLLLMCHAYKEVMRKTGWEAGKVHCVFITKTNLINREDMEELWDWLGVTVIDNAKMHGEIATDIHDLTEEREQLDHFIDNCALATWKLDPQYDRMEENFHSSEPSSYDDDNDEDDSTHDGSEEDEDDNDDKPEDESSGNTEDTPIPDIEELFSSLLDEWIKKNKEEEDEEEEKKREEYIKEQFTFSPFEGPGSTESSSEDDEEDEDETKRSQEPEDTGKTGRQRPGSRLLRVATEDDILEMRKRKDDAMGPNHDEEPPKVDLPDLGPLKGVEIIQPISHPLEQLNKLVGLDEIKKRILTLTMLAKYNALLKENGAKAHKISLHSIFYGNPGTGKTIVGRMYASILREAGILSKGHVVLANGRQSFVGTLFGEEEKNVDNLLRLAQGGVLMIDEAYTLSTSHKDDPGKNVLPLLMKAMADEENRDFAVILTGYQKPVEQLLELNPGLDSRFPEVNRFLFHDFSPVELCKIAKVKLAEYGYTLTPHAWAKLKAIITAEYASRDIKAFGNGRFVANLLEEIYQRHAVRCIRCHVTKLSELHCITASDIQQENPGRRKRVKRTIGFA